MRVIVQQALRINILECALDEIGSRLGQTITQLFRLVGKGAAD